MGDPPSITQPVEGTGIISYTESYTVNNGDTTLIVVVRTVPVLQAIVIELIQNEIAIDGAPLLTGSIVSDTGEPEDLTGSATPEPETRTSRTGQTSNATPEPTEDVERTTRTTRNASVTPEATDEPEATEESTTVITRTSRTGSGDDGTPEVTEAPDPESSLTPGMESYTGSIYGYTIYYDGSLWEDDFRLDSTNMDGVRLSGDSSTVVLFAVDVYGADPVACLTGENDYYATGTERISDWEVAIGADGEPLWFESEDLAWGVFRYVFTTSSGTEVEFVDYISCETVPGQDAVFVVQLSSLPDDYNVNLDAVLDILETIEFRP